MKKIPATLVPGDGVGPEIMCGITWRATIQAPLRLMSIIASQAGSDSSCASP